MTIMNNAEKKAPIWMDTNMENRKRVSLIFKDMKKSPPKAHSSDKILIYFSLIEGLVNH